MIEFNDCKNGLYFGSFVTNQGDGIIKITPGGFKPKARAKSTSLVSQWFPKPFTMLIVIFFSRNSSFSMDLASSQLAPKKLRSTALVIFR